MAFMNEVKRTLGDEFNYSRTENGALGYRTTQNALLDLNFNVSSLRKASIDDIVNRFMLAYHENPILALKWLFYSRDIRGGLGERRLFRIVINHLAQEKPEMITPLIDLVGEYGRYDDLLYLLSTQLKPQVLEYIGLTLSKDIDSYNQGKSTTLLAKWLPSINASSEITKEQGRMIATYLGMTERQYRKILSKLRKHIDVVEARMCSGDWEGINYSAVPSRAALLYREAFTRHDSERYFEFLEAVKKGESKINAGTLYPHDIVHRYTNGNSRVYGGVQDDLEEFWKALPNTIEGDDRTLVVRDGSGSMNWGTIGNTKVTALDVSTALAIYFAERMTGEFHDQFITFSNRPSLIDLSNLTTLYDKLDRTYRENDCSNTDIHAVFRLILATAVRAGMKQEDLPTNILILSDMEFDGRSLRWDARLFDEISAEYEQYGYKLPRLVFWNLNSRTGTIPVTQNELGVALISGFSTNLAKMVQSNQTDPFECLKEVLNSERYALIEERLTK